MLGYKNSTPQAQQSYQSLLQTGWTHTWDLWYISLSEKGGFSYPQSTASQIP